MNENWNEAETVEAAIQLRPDANWLLISVEGARGLAAAEAGLAAGRHLFIHSADLSLTEERRLKAAAAERGLLVMGPGCGTAMINGIGLGFANLVRRGNIGIVAASGSGLQAVSSEVHNLGGGISQGIGTGERDLHEAVGGISTAQGIHLLATDESTSVIVLISKPPAPTVVTPLLRRAQTCGKPVVVCFQGFAAPGRQIGNLHFASGLTDAAEMAVRIANAPGIENVLGQQRRPFHGTLRGLFSGGTLAQEMLSGLQAVCNPVFSNIAADPAQQLTDLQRSEGHMILDMGAAPFTNGGEHPLLNDRRRVARLRQEAADESVGMIVLDVVLGEGVDLDPAVELAPAIADATQLGKKVVAIVIGTERDPQDVNQQIERLIAAGATVLANTNEGLDYIYNRVPEPDPLPPLQWVENADIKVINVGLTAFAESVVRQGGTAVQVRET